VRSGASHLWGLGGAVALVIVLAALMVPVAARADCGGAATAEPSHHVRGELPPLVIGDSTMLLALYQLAGEGYDAEAQGCRQFPAALAMLSARKSEGTLPHMVVIALGANGSVTPEDVGEALGLLCCQRLLVLVTPRELGGGSGPDAAVEREQAQRHPGRILLLDWVDYSQGHPDWFQPDGLHLTTAGATAFTRLLARALPYAHAKRRPKPKPKPEPKPKRHPPHGSHGHRDRSGSADASPTTSPGRGSPSRRLATRIDRTAVVGGALTIALRDRWGIGGLPITICVSAPGGGRACGRWRWRTGEPSRVIHIATPRPGGWRVTVKTRDQTETRASVWAAHPGGRIRLLAAGDSEMQILDDFLGQDLQVHGVDVTSDARISTGLTNPFFFDWQGHAVQEAGSLRPDVTVIFMGANDGFAVRGAHGELIPCCGPSWSGGYATLVARMMATYLRGSSGRVYWFTLPTPSPDNFQSVFDGVNGGIRLAAKRFPGRVGLIDANAFFTPGTRYRDFMTYQGRGFVIHESDGVHLSVASDAVAATLVVQRLLADHVIR
jgi:lysophospholipase L1-like esterase